jgi:hypothetical protein
MSHLRTGTIVLLGAALGAMVMLAAQAARAPAAPVQGGQAGEVGELRAELQALARRVTQGETVRALTVAARPVGLPERPAAAAPTPVSPSSRADPIDPAVAERNDRRYRERLEAHFAGERADPRWAVPTLLLTRERLERMLPVGSQLVGLDCRATLCRLETAHVDLDQFRAFVSAAFVDSQTYVWDGPTWSALTSESTDGSVVTVSYLAKGGETLPPWADPAAEPGRNQ